MRSFWGKWLWAQSKIKLFRRTELWSLCTFLIDKLTVTVVFSLSLRVIGQIVFSWQKWQEYSSWFLKILLTVKVLPVPFYPYLCFYYLLLSIQLFLRFHRRKCSNFERRSFIKNLRCITFILIRMFDINYQFILLIIYYRKNMSKYFIWI